MQSLNINQLIIDGLVPLSYASQHIVYRLFDVHDRQESLSVDNIRQIIVNHSPFRNKNITALLHSALTSDSTTFRQTLHDFKMIHKKIFSQEINQHDQYQNSLIWYLTIADRYKSIEELVRLSDGELNINLKNGLYNQTILHYAVTHASFEQIQTLLDIGVDTNHRDRYGRTALHYVALYSTKDNNNIKIAQLLIDHGIILNLEDSFGQTSLHFAIVKEDYDFIEYLISLPDSNIWIRDERGYTPLCYLCEHILHSSNNLSENHQSTNDLTRLFKIMQMIIDRCSLDQLSVNFYIVKKNEIQKNLLLSIHEKFNSYKIPFYTDIILNRITSIMFSSDQEHCLFVKQQLLNLSSWKSAISGLSNTDHVDVSDALIQCLIDDPHVLLENHLSISSNLSRFFVLIFYCLATNVTILQNIVPMCNYSNQSCEMYIKNYELHTNYTIFIHTCLHYAYSNVFSLKHLCRYLIRQYFKSNIIDRIDRCSSLKLEHRKYLQLNELSTIYFQIHDLSSIVYLIQRLYNIHSVVEEQKTQNEMKYEVEELVEISSNDKMIQIGLQSDYSNDDKDQSKLTKIQSIRQQTLDEIMAQSDIPFSDLSEDLQINLPSISSTISDHEISTEQLENELANVHMKTRNIEEMIEKFFSDV